MNATITSEIIVESLTKLGQTRQYDEMLDQARHYLSLETLTPIQKFRAVQTVILRHSDHRAGLPLIEIARDALLSEMEFCRAFLAFYELKLTGESVFMDTLGPVEKQKVSEAIGFFSEHAIEPEISVATRLMDGGLKSADAGEMVIEAIRSKRPFSVLRMGDGEGRFMFPMFGMPALEEHTNTIASRIWFWNSTWPRDQFWEDLRTAYVECSIAGISPAYRIDLEYRNSILGYIGVVNGNRFLLQAKEDGATSAYAFGWFMHELGDTFMSRVMEEAKTVNFIGPHSEIAPVLASKGAREVRVITVPSDNLVPNAVEAPHYPDVFEDVKAQIKAGADGVWLVSSGAYGKIYCNEVRKAGGVALDIGSMSDKWMQLKTR